MITGSRTSVSAWSVLRLPFEPRGWQMEFRTQLRSALREVDHGDDSALVATYASPDDSFVDVENVLLYNVGSASLSPLMAGGVVCSRIPSANELHHVSYSVVPSLPDPDPLATDTLATLEATVARWPSSAGAWWTLLRPGAERVASDTHEAQFCVDVTLTGPDLRGTRVAGMVKSLLDGAISALHAHDGSGRTVLLERLRALGEPEHAWQQLVNVETAVLGRRTLVRPYRDGVAWNPADDRCTSFRFATAQATERHIQVFIRRHSRPN